jgi:hypothetical protein
MTIGSLVIALILVVIFLQPFNDLAHKSFTLASLLNPYMIVIVLVIVLLMAAISGSYPAIYLSGFRPAEVLKGQGHSGTWGGIVSQESRYDTVCRIARIDHLNLYRNPSDGLLCKRPN